MSKESPKIALPSEDELRAELQAKVSVASYGDLLGMRQPTRAELDARGRGLLSDGGVTEPYTVFFMDGRYYVTTELSQADREAMRRDGVVVES